MPTSPKVFISYSHDSEAHARRVRALADRLRSDGLDCALDQYESAPPQGWPLWMDQQVETADFVLVISTETYLRRATGQERPGVGRGVRFESVLIVQDLYDAGMWNDKFIPVLLAGASPANVIKPLRPYTHCRGDTDDGYEDLYRRLTGQPRIVRPPLGKRRSLPPEKPGAPPPAGASEEVATAQDADGQQPAVERTAAPPSTDGEDGAEAQQKPLWKRLTGPVGFAVAVLGIVTAVLTILSLVLDLPGKYRQLLGEAVSAYRLALQIYTRDALPQDWAMTQHNLGLALENQGIRTVGDAGARLLGEAVSAYRLALQVRTRDALPQGWAMTQYNLGTALQNQGIRMGGEAGARLLGEAASAYRGRGP